MGSPPEEPYLRITATRSGGRMVVAATGELDLSNAEMYTVRVREELAAGPVLIDFSGLGFMDSSGVRLIDALLRESAAEGWTLAICSDLPDNVRQLLEVTGMLAELPMEDR